MDKSEMAVPFSKEQTAGNWTKGRAYIGFLDGVQLSSAEISRMKIGGISNSEVWGAQGLGFHVQGLVAFVQTFHPNLA